MNNEKTRYRYRFAYAGAAGLPGGALHFIFTNLYDGCTDLDPSLPLPWATPETHTTDSSCYRLRLSYSYASSSRLSSPDDPARRLSC